MKFNKYLALILRVLVSLILIFILIIQIKRQQSWRDIWQVFGFLNYSLIAAAAGIYIAGVVLSTVQWHILLRIQNIKLSFNDTFSFYMIGLFFSNFLPSSIGGDIVRGYDVAKKSDQTEKTIASIIMDRVLGFLALASIGVIFLAISNKEYYIPLLILLGTIAASLLFFSTKFIKIVNNFLLKFNKSRLREILIKIINSFLLFKGKKWFWAAIVLAFISQWVRTAMVYFIALAMKLGISFTTIFISVPIVGIASALPISINGIGIREYTGKTILQNFYNIDIGHSTILFFYAYLVTVLVSLAGGIIFTFKSIRRA